MTRLLIAGAVVGSFAVLGMTLAIVGRVRRKRIDASKVATRKAPREFFEAGEFRTPRPLRLHQDLPRRPLAEISFPASQEPAPQPQKPAPQNPALQNPALQNHRPLQNQKIPAGNPIATGTFSPSGVANPSPVQLRPVFAVQPQQPAAGPLPHRVDGLRKPPQSATLAGTSRVSLSYFYKETGQLIDPRVRFKDDSQPAGGTGSPTRPAGSNEKINKSA